MPSSNPRSIGEFVWNTTTGQWRWDAGMYELHGYGPGDVAVSSELVLQHKHDQHRAHAAEVLQMAASVDRRFSNYHRIVDARGRRRTVLVVGESRVDPSRPSLAHRLSRGFMVDVTEDEDDATRHAVGQARQSTAPIQQSVGLLMGSLGLTEDAAFSVMSRVSQHSNVKLRDLAARFVAAAVASAADSSRDLTGLLLAQATALAADRTPKHGATTR